MFIYVTDEVEFLLGNDVALRALSDPSEVLSTLAGSVRGVIVTDGAKGSSYCFSVGMKPVVGRINAFKPTNVVDTTGCGDAYFAGFIAELFARGGATMLGNAEVVRACAIYGAATAACVASGNGGIDPLPTREEVELFIACHNE
jgi:fructokinase